MAIIAKTEEKDEKAEASHDILSLLNYIKPLLNAPEEGLSHQELANKVKVSEPAVSKMRKKLLEICDVNHYWLGGKRKFKLNYSFEVAATLLFFFGMDAKLHYFMKSRYVRNALLKIDFHALICQKWNLYGAYFNKEDTDCLVKIILENIQALPETRWRFFKAKSEHQMITLVLEDIQENLPLLVDKFKLPISSNEELVKAVNLRRKAYSLVKHIVTGLIDKSRPVQFLKSKGDPNYEKYREGYIYFTNYYINRIFDSISDAIKKSCPIGVVYKNEYDDNQVNGR